jgi:hypothetical protein
MNPTMADVAASGPIPFDVKRASLSIQVKFLKQFWPLFHNIPSLYSALLERLSAFGVTPQGIKSEVGDGSLGAYNVNFWLLGFRALVRIRLEQVEVDFNSITEADLDLFEKAFLELLAALYQASPEAGASSYTFDLGLHGDLAGVEHKEYLSRFARSIPQLPGPFIGCGFVFYFGAEGPATLRSASADLSGAMPGKLFVRVFSVYNATVELSGLRSLIEGDRGAALSALNLARGEQ